MPLFKLNENLLFPDPQLAEENGLLAVGGDLTSSRLLLAYEHGIFPWFNPEDPILWWSPDPRFVLYPHELKVSKSMRSVIKKGVFEISFDSAFEEVITQCSVTKREGEHGSWITDEMRTAYTELHKLGMAHSVEAWQDGELVGGLYGVALGSIFFGESMFHHVSNASKAAFIHLVGKLTEWGFDIIDCQLHTNHLHSLGGKEMPRSEYLSVLGQTLKNDSKIGSWNGLA